MHTPPPEESRHVNVNSALRDQTLVDLVKFYSSMEKELRENIAGKGEWEDWTPAWPSLIADLNYHLKKLEEAVGVRDRLGVSEHAADLGNLCMKAAVLFGSLRD